MTREGLTQNRLWDFVSTLNLGAWGGAPQKSQFHAVVVGLALTLASLARAQDALPVVTPADDGAPASLDVAPAAPPVEAPTAPPVDDDVVARARTPVQALTEHFVGSTARAVRFDWRRAPVMVGLSAGEVVEKNNFSAQRYGLLGRKAFSDLILEVGVQLYLSDDTASSELLALTPYRQAGRPAHLELDLNLGYAIAEGVVTPLAAFMPPAEVALVALGGVRYLGYWQTFPDRPIQDIGLSLASPQLSQIELERLDRDAPEAMAIDPARLHALVGLAVDTYLQPGLWVSPRAMLAVPVLVPVTNTSLGLFWELTLAVGWAF